MWMSTPANSTAPTGPLEGLRVIELASLGPGPHAAMVLADLGADVLRVEAPDGGRGLRFGSSGSVDGSLRGRRTVELNLRNTEGTGALLALAAEADVLIEGMRPGVAERLGVGPATCRGLNPGLVYGRITGWGQDGQLARTPGHDINYLGLSGALRAIGDASQSPPPPLNLVADFGGGSMLLLVGLLAALVERERSGLGQVVDAAMVDGAVLLSQFVLSLRGMGQWSDERSTNLLDGGAPFYRCYQCADGEFVAVGALEPRFYAALLSGLGLDETALPAQDDRAGWPELEKLFSQAFATRSRDEWAEWFARTEACVTPVLSFEEAPRHPHNRERGNFIESAGVMQAAPAPRFSRSQVPVTPLLPKPTTVEEALASWRSPA